MALDDRHDRFDDLVHRLKELGLAGVLGHQLFHERTDCITGLRHCCYTLLELDLWGALGCGASLARHPLGAGVRMLILRGLQSAATPVLEIVGIAAANNGSEGRLDCPVPTDSVTATRNSGTNDHLDA